MKRFNTKKVKIVITILIVSILALSCNSQQPSKDLLKKDFTISGALKNMTGGKLVLTDLDSSKIIFASTALKADSTFSMNVPVPLKEQAYLLVFRSLNNGDSLDLPLATLVNRKDDIKITFDGNKIMQTKIEGSLNSQKLNDFITAYALLANDFNKAVYGAMYVNDKLNSGTSDKNTDAIASATDSLLLASRKKTYLLIENFIKGSDSEVSVATAIYVATQYLEPEDGEKLTALALQKFKTSAPIKELHKDFKADRQLND